MLPILEEKVLFEHDFVGTAVTRLPDDYLGPCEVVLEGRTRLVLVLPTVDDAYSAAKFAVGELGGYLRAVVNTKQPEQEVTHQTWTDWAFA